MILQEMREMGQTSRRINEDRDHDAINKALHDGAKALSELGFSAKVVNHPSDEDWEVIELDLAFDEFMNASPFSFMSDEDDSRIRNKPIYISYTPG